MSTETIRNPKLDEFEHTFNDWEEMLDYHKEEAKNSLWKRVPISEMKVFPVTDDTTSPYGYDVSVSEEAIADTWSHSRLGMCIKTSNEDEDPEYYSFPLRDTAVKGLFDRAKINGLSLQRLSAENLSEVLNKCLALYEFNEALCLIRDEKITACHSGDRKDYSVLPIDELLGILKSKLETRFKKATFLKGFSDHSITVATFSLDDENSALLSDYKDKLRAAGINIFADNVYPGVKFTTSDTGVSCARCSAYLLGNGTPISMGSALQVEHRYQASLDDFENEVGQLFSRFGDSVEKLKDLLDIQIQYPISCMERICKRLKLPKRQSLEAINQFEMANGDDPCTAHDIYLAMQEIIFLCRTGDEPMSQAKLFSVEENLCRALELKWNQFDLAKRINW